MRKIILLICILALQGCASATYIYTDKKQVKSGSLVEVEIISEPPGAKIEIENDYLGKTPLTVYIRRGFDELGYNSVSIIASPSKPGQFVQEKWIRRNQEMPNRIYFDMRLHPINPESNVNLNINKK